MDDFYATENFSTRRYGKLDQRLIDRAFKFLFPDESWASPVYGKFTKLVNKKFDKLGCAVVWQRNAGNLPVGSKEVVITSQAVRATEDYRYIPTLLFSL